MPGSLSQPCRVGRSVSASRWNVIANGGLLPQSGRLGGFDGLLQLIEQGPPGREVEFHGDTRARSEVIVREIDQESVFGVAVAGVVKTYRRLRERKPAVRAFAAPRHCCGRRDGCAHGAPLSLSVASQRSRTPCSSRPWP